MALMKILGHLLKKGNRELMAKVNLGQTSHVSESYTSQLYQNSQVDQYFKVLLIWIKKKIKSYSKS